MDFNLSNEQRSWQMTARKFADEEIRPISLERDAISDRARDLGLGHHQEGLQARLPHPGGAEGMGRPRHRFRDAGAGDGRARQGRQRDFQGLQPELEMEPPDLGRPAPRSRSSASCRASSPTTPWCSARASPSRAPAPTTACRRTIPKAGIKLSAERKGDEWILNGEKAFIANAPVGKLFFIDARTDATVPPKQGTTIVPGAVATRPASASARCSTRAAGASTRTAR